MQDSPDRISLLRAVARFLQQDLLPHVADRALAFRLLVAAHLATMVAAELAAEEEEDEAQLRRLRALLPEQAPPEGPLGPTARREAIRALEAELARRLRAGDLRDPAAAREHILSTLREKLRVVSPRFDLSATIE